jgi:hypothetical protein
MDRQPLRVIVYAWGRPYVDRLLDYTVASLLAPGNLPSLVDFFDCTLAVVTEEKLFRYIESHPLIRRIKLLCPVRLVSLDDLIGEPWQYGISLAFALFRGFSDLGEAMTKTYLLFLNADFVLADGCYDRLIPHMKRGERVLLSPSYCVAEEEVEPLLAKIRINDHGMLAIPPRQLARIIIDYRHNTIRAKTINQCGVHFEYMDQAYWKVNDDTIIGYQMPICMVAMRPEVALTEINTFWDWGIVYEFCPSRELTVLGDSDEFLMLELRNENAHLDSIRLGPTTPRAAAARMSTYLTRYQIDNARFPLTLHADSVPKDTDGPRSKLQGFMDELLRSYRTGPLLSHRNHPQWLYHKSHLARHLEIKKLRQRLQRLDKEYEAERAKAVKVLGQGSGLVDRNVAEAHEELFERHEAATSKEKARLALLEEASLPPMGDFFEHIVFADAERANGTRFGRGGFRRITRRAAAGLVGTIPRTRSWHPLHFLYRDIGAALDRAEGADWGILFVGEKDGLSCRVGARQANPCFRISPAGLLRSQVEPAVDEPWCGLAVIELGQGDFQHLRALRQTVLPHMLPSGRILMFWINFDCESGKPLQRAFAQAAEMKNEGASVRFFTLTRGWGGLDLVKAVRATPSTRKSYRGLALLVALMRLLRHHFLRQRPKVGEAASGNCLGVMIEIEVCLRLPEADRYTT